MRPLPGVESRVAQDPFPAVITRERAHADQHLRILRAVGELAAEHGCANLSVEAIVKRAHVSYRTFYTHFSDKEQCLLALCENATRATDKAIHRRLAVRARPWPERVALALGTLIELIIGEPIIARAVLVEAPRVGPGGFERHQRAARVLVPLFREGRGLNRRASELALTTEIALAGSIVWSIYGQLLVGPADGLVELLPGLTELVLRTYCAEA